MISERMQSHYDNQNKNRLNYCDFFRRLVELQNEMNQYRTTLFVDLNEEESINRIKNFQNIEDVL